jgi:hypothetical protein
MRLLGLTLVLASLSRFGPPVAPVQALVSALVYAVTAAQLLVFGAQDEGSSA